MKKAVILLALLASAPALGCADAEKREEEIALRVSATVAAMASAGPALTPYPTYTLVPVSPPSWIKPRTFRIRFPVAV